MLDAIRETTLIWRTKRSHFVILNENFVPLPKYYSGVNRKLILKKVPMANNNKGAFWLAIKKENSQSVLWRANDSCGSIIDSIP